MFEPENDIERLLMRASAEPAERPGFARALMDAEIVLVLVPEGGDPIVPGPDGNAVIPEGTKMVLPSICGRTIISRQCVFTLSRFSILRMRLFSASVMPRKSVRRSRLGMRETGPAKPANRAGVRLPVRIA